MSSKGEGGKPLQACGPIRNCGRMISETVLQRRSRLVGEAAARGIAS